MSGTKPLTVLFLPNARRADRYLDVSGDPLNPRRFFEDLSALGFIVKSRRLNVFPVNPLLKCGTFYAGFDVVRALCVLALDRRVDVIVSIGESNLVVILMLAKLMRFKPRIVLREIAPRGWSKRDRVVDLVLPRLDRIFVLTPHQKGWAEANFRLKAPVELVGFATDETFYTPQGCQDGGYILAVGDDVGRDYACLIAACRNTPYKLLLRTDTKPAIPDDMQSRVTVMGRVSTTALRDLYAAASVVVVSLLQVDHPSGITTLFEAMAMGRAVVASHVGSTSHAIKSGENGLLVAVGDVSAMRAALTSLMQNEPLRRLLGNNARTTIETDFSYVSFVQRFAASLRSVVERV